MEWKKLTLEEIEYQFDGISFKRKIIFKSFIIIIIFKKKTF